MIEIATFARAERFELIEAGRTERGRENVFWENGFNLKERLVPQGLSKRRKAAVEAL